VRRSYNGSREPHDVGRALLRTNRGRRGGQFTVNDSWVAELAAARDIAHMLCLELDGYLERTGGGPITSSAPQRCKRISALRVEEAGVVLHVGGFDVLGVDRSLSQRPARRWRRHRRGVPLHWQQCRQAVEVWAEVRRRETTCPQRPAGLLTKGCWSGCSQTIAPAMTGVRAHRHGTEECRRAEKVRRGGPLAHSDGAHGSCKDIVATCRAVKGQLVCRPTKAAPSLPTTRMLVVSYPLYKMQQLMYTL